MRVSELIAALQALPPDIDVMIEGYEAGTEDGNIGYSVEAVEGWQSGDGVRSCAVWARRITKST